MSNVFGNLFKVSLFGESHSKAIGVTIDGITPGLQIDMDEVNQELGRRAPGQDDYSTARCEADSPHIVSGFFKGRATGTPLCAIIYNTNTISADYDELSEKYRPSHADYTGAVKYSGYQDYRGGGHFSGRLTAPLVFAGAIAKQMLARKGIVIGAHIASIKDIKDDSFCQYPIDKNLLLRFRESRFPTIQEEAAGKMKQTIAAAKKNCDSVGGVIECMAIGLRPGIGQPFFDSVESRLSSMLFSIPAVKGVEFGLGFDITKLFGSEANDAFYIKEHTVYTETNHSGGINGGISNGMPITFKVAFRPTASIAKEQHTVNRKTGENTTLVIKGRHDPCIVPRAVPVIEAACAIVLVDLLLEGGETFVIN